MKNILLWSFPSYLVILILVICSCGEVLIDKEEQKEESVKDEQNEEFVKENSYRPYRIYIMNTDGTGIIDLDIRGEAPAWSPDGQKLVFHYDTGGYEPPGREVIYIVNVDGTEKILLTRDSATNKFPVWSPDGQKIAFMSYRDGNMGIFVINIDGTEQARLTDNYGDNSPAWSPDGQKIVFRSGNWEIYVMNNDGTKLTRLTNNPAIDTAPAWSPNGQKIAFISDR